MMDFAMQLTGKIKTRATISCTECGREFQRNRKADLQRHMRIHTNEKPFVCPFPECKRAFRQSSALKNHSNYHQRDQSFTCGHCNLNFFDKPTFNRHIREKHDLEYVYACSVPGCGKHFKRKPVFKAHMQDRHSIVCNDHDTLNHRVSAAPYLKAASGSKSAFHSSSSPLPKLSEALPNVHEPSVQINNGIYYSSNPAMYGMNNADAVLLTDPYANVSMKPAPSTYAASTYYGQQSPEFTASYNSTPSAAVWLPAYGPNDTTYFDGQILNASQLAACMPSGTPMISFSPASSPIRNSPNPSFMLSSGASSGQSGMVSMGSYSPHSPPRHSRSPSSSPISPIVTPGQELPQDTLRPYGSPPFY